MRVWWVPCSAAVLIDSSEVRLPHVLRSRRTNSLFWEWVLHLLANDEEEVEAAGITAAIEDALGYEEEILRRDLAWLADEVDQVHGRAARARACLELAIRRAPYGRRSSIPHVAEETSGT